MQIKLAYKVIFFGDDLFCNKYKNKYKLEVAVKWLEIEVGMDVLLLLIMFIIGVMHAPGEGVSKV